MSSSRPARPCRWRRKDCCEGQVPAGPAGDAQASGGAGAPRAEQAAARAEAARRAEAERSLFQRAAGPVQRLPDRGRVHHPPEPVAPLPAQRQLDDQRVLKESISDEFDASTLLEVDEALSFRRPGVGIDVARKLRRGYWSIQAEIDLHGLRADDAREALAGFVREAAAPGPALPAGGARQGPGLARQDPGAQGQGARLAGAEERGAGLRAGARGRRRRGSPGGALEAIRLDGRALLQRGLRLGS